MAFRAGSCCVKTNSFVQFSVQLSPALGNCQCCAIAYAMVHGIYTQLWQTSEARRLLSTRPREGSLESRPQRRNEASEFDIVGQVPEVFARLQRNRNSLA